MGENNSLDLVVNQGGTSGEGISNKIVLPSSPSGKRVLLEALHLLVPIEGQRHMIQSLSKRMNPDNNTFNRYVNGLVVVTAYQFYAWWPMTFVIDYYLK